MDATRCHECGDTRPLGPTGACVWRAGCEHRQLVDEARMAELDLLFDTTPEHDDGTLNLGIRREWPAVARNDFGVFAEEFEHITHADGARLWWENGQWFESRWSFDELEGDDL